MKDSKNKFNIHKISTALIFLYVFFNSVEVIDKFSGFLFDHSRNSFGDADITFVLEDTTYIWKNIKGGTFKVSQEPCKPECFKSYAEAETSEGNRYWRFDISNYKSVTVDYHDPDISSAIYMSGTLNR